MFDASNVTNPISVWKNQQLEKCGMDLKQFVGRRTQELYTSTRSDILLSIVAVVFFVAVLMWRLNFAQDHLPSFGLLAVAAWLSISVYWFRSRILRRVSPSLDAAASTGWEYYRRELERRRDHLKNVWLWHGPLLLACMVSVAAFSGKAFPTVARLKNAAPLIFLLLIWIGFSARSRWRQAMQIQREIDDMEML